MSSFDAEQMISQYISSTWNAVKALYDKALYGQVLLIIYSAIDTCGLLGASSEVVSASGDSFKKWAKKYLQIGSQVGLNEDDLWAARCGVLHTFTAESDNTRNGKARKIVYYTGDPDTQEIKKVINETQSLGYLPVHYGDLVKAFSKAILKFKPELDALCKSDSAYSSRLGKVLQIYSL